MRVCYSSCRTVALHHISVARRANDNLRQPKEKKNNRNNVPLPLYSSSCYVDLQAEGVCGLLKMGQKMAGQESGQLSKYISFSTLISGEKTKCYPVEFKKVNFIPYCIRF
jgi:hypothetical protein